MASYSKNNYKLNSLDARVSINNVTFLNTFEPSTEVIFTLPMYLVRNLTREDLLKISNNFLSKS